jgi:hypothetical protein
MPPNTNVPWIASMRARQRMTGIGEDVFRATRTLLSEKQPFHPDGIFSFFLVGVLPL